MFQIMFFSPPWSLRVRPSMKIANPNQNGNNRLILIAGKILKIEYATKLKKIVKTSWQRIQNFIELNPGIFKPACY